MPIIEMPVFTSDEIDIPSDFKYLRDWIVGVFEYNRIVN